MRYVVRGGRMRLAVDVSGSILNGQGFLPKISTSSCGCLMCVSRARGEDRVGLVSMNLVR